MIWVMSLSMSTLLTKAKFLFSETSNFEVFAFTERISFHGDNWAGDFDRSQLTAITNVPSPILVTKSGIKMKANRVHTENK